MDYFQWVETDAKEGCVLAYLRRSENQTLLVLLNLGDVSYPALEVLLEKPARLRTLLSSDEGRFGGWNAVTWESTTTAPSDPGDTRFSCAVQLPAYASCICELTEEGAGAAEGDGLL